MKQFVERLATDKEFAAEFREFMLGKNETVKEGTKLVGQHLDKLVMTAVKEFADSKGIALQDDDQAKKPLSELSHQICLQLDDMIVKSFVTLEGSVKQPVDMPPELVEVIKNNKDLFSECCHKADQAAKEAVEKCGKEMNAAVMAAFKEFAEKTGYQGDFNDVQINKEIAKRLNDVITTQLNGLIEISRTSK